MKLLQFLTLGCCLAMPAAVLAQKGGHGGGGHSGGGHAGGGHASGGHTGGGHAASGGHAAGGTHRLERWLERQRRRVSRPEPERASRRDRRQRPQGGREHA